MNLRDLEYFVAVAELGHFHAAADRCCVSQPTLSGQIKKLEAELGHALFERDTRSVRLSNFGQEALELARRSLRAVQDLQDRAKALHDPLVGPVSLGAFPTLGPWFFPRLSPELSAQFPKAEFYLIEEKTATLLSQLRDGSLDAAFLALPVEGTDLVSLGLFQENFLLAVPQNHPWSQRSHIQSHELEQQELLLLADGHCLRNQALDLCHRYGAREGGTFRATGLETLRQMVRLGRGLTLMPRLAIADSPNDGLAYISIGDGDFHRDIGLVFRSTHPRQGLFQALSRTVQALYSDCCQLTL